MSAIIRIETERLLLRELTLYDVDNIMQIFADPVAMRYYPSTKTEEEAKIWITNQIQNYGTYGYGLWAAILKENNKFVGQVGLVPQIIDDRDEVEIGYLFVREFWGRGLATEAAIACRDYGFYTLGCDRLISLINPENVRSIRVAERVGMTLEKTTLFHGRPTLVYSIHKQEFAE